MKDMPETNEIVAGKWFSDAPGVAEASVEQGIAKTLRLKLGDVHALRHRRHSMSTRR